MKSTKSTPGMRRTALTQRVRAERTERRRRRAVGEAAALKTENDALRRELQADHRDFRHDHEQLRAIADLVERLDPKRRKKRGRRRRLVGLVLAGTAAWVARDASTRERAARFVRDLTGNRRLTDRATRMTTEILNRARHTASVVLANGAS